MAPRPEKVAVVDRVSEQLTGAAATLLTDYRGLSVTELADLRAELRKVDATYEVVKNTLTRLAARQAGMDGLDEMLVGPTALVFCGEDPVGPAKALKAFAKDHEALVVKGGYLDGAVLEAEEAVRLAELASREDLLATFAGMMNNALAGFARLLQAPLSEMARLQQALVDDGGVEAKGFSPEGAAPAADEATADADAPEATAADADATEATAADADAADGVGEPTEGAGATIDDADAVVETAASDDLTDTAQDVPTTDEGATDDAAAPAGAAADEQTVADGALDDIAPDAGETAEGTPAAEATEEEGVPAEAEAAPSADTAEGATAEDVSAEAITDPDDAPEDAVTVEADGEPDGDDD